MHSSTMDSNRFDKKIRRVLVGHTDLDHGALAVHPYHARRLVDTLGRTFKQQYHGPHSIGID